MRDTIAIARMHGIVLHIKTIPAHEDIVMSIPQAHNNQFVQSLHPNLLFKPQLVT